MMITVLKCATPVNITYIPLSFSASLSICSLWEHPYRVWQQIVCVFLMQK
jgi:hypothetical protein